MEYIISEEELEKLIEFYDTENRSKFVGDDNSLKRVKRAICNFLQSKKQAELSVCNCHLHRDFNASLNILALGLQSLGLVPRSSRL